MWPYSLLASLISIEIQGIPLTLDLANTEVARQEGLFSHPTPIVDNEGMLFIFNPPEIPLFWMGHLSYPLSIAFFDSRRCLVEVQEMSIWGLEPCFHFPTKPIAYAIEMPAYWFTRHQISARAQFSFQ
jgi:uncharacterized membrane protein (UPF0127 family)